MPSIVKKLVIFATADGLVLQPHGRWDHDHSIRIEFKGKSIVSHPKLDPKTFKPSPHLESHGIIGLLTIASFSFLLCITRREQVAQIFGLPIYVIKDVAILPLSSRAEFDQAVIQARASLQKAKSSQYSDAASSESEESGHDSVDDHSVGDASESQTTANESVQTDPRSEWRPSVAQDVIQRKGQYGRFASQWFSKMAWGSDNKRDQERSGEMIPMTDHGRQKLEPVTGDSVHHEESSPKISEAVHHYSAGDEMSTVQRASHEAAIDMLPNILQTTKLLFSSRSFYFSYDFDITRRFGNFSVTSLNSAFPESVEQQYFWNRQLVTPFLKAGLSSAIMPVMQGFVGQQSFIVKDISSEETHTEALAFPKTLAKAGDFKPNIDQPTHTNDSPRTFLLTLISRRSVKRSGLRYLRRGIDDEGHCANSVETEQILSSSTWADPARICSFAQCRASIPLYFSQSPYAFKPVPTLHQPPEINRNAFDRHFEGLRQRYGLIQVVLLVDKQGSEKKIGEEYENITKFSNATCAAHEIGFEWFDFHDECRGMKFENVQKLVHNLEDTLNSFGETVICGKTTKSRQSGIIRTNCMDCLDRTNVVQSAFAQYMLQKDLEREGLEVDFVHDSSTRWFNSLWADNGDAISRQYASTAALKGDYTRTRKRDYRGALNDFGLTLTRYYNNVVNDYFSQTVVDVLLGNVSSGIFDDFEATMMSADPGVSINKVRQNAIDTCSKIVIQRPEENMVLGEAMLTPAHANTLRTLPFEEAILLLTNYAVYGCKFDWNTEKVASFERIGLRSIASIRYGTYITSTMTEGQMDEALNVGLVISYAPGKESIKRVNTRSLQVSADIEASSTKAGTGQSTIMSWLRARSPGTSQYMAMKAIPKRSLAKETIGSSPLAAVEQICNQIQQARADNLGLDAEHEIDLVEKADIISLADARSRTGYLEQIGHSIKKLVWT